MQALSSRNRSSFSFSMREDPESSAGPKAGPRVRDFKPPPLAAGTGQRALRGPNNLSWVEGMNERTEGAGGRGLHWGNLRRKQGSSVPSWQKSKESHGSQGLGHEPNKTDLIPSQWKQTAKQSAILRASWGRISGFELRLPIYPSSMTLAKLT